MMNFQKSSFQNFKNKSKTFKKNAFENKAIEFGFNPLTIEIVEYWNSKNIKKHKIQKSKILTRLDKIIKNGLISSPALFDIEKIKNIIDIYSKHLNTGYSKLSRGNGSVFKFSVDDFFKFSKFQRERINNSKTFEILRNKRSLYISLIKDEKQFFYPVKEARNEFNQLYNAIANNLNINPESVDPETKKYSLLTIQKYFDNNKGKLVFYDGLISDYERQNSEIFYSLELFYVWILRFIKSKNNNFKIEHLNAKFFWENFTKWMNGLGRCM